MDHSLDVLSFARTSALRHSRYPRWSRDIVWPHSEWTDSMLLVLYQQGFVMRLSADRVATTVEGLEALARSGNQDAADDLALLEEIVERVPKLIEFEGQWLAVEDVAAILKLPVEDVTRLWVLLISAGFHRGASWDETSGFVRRIQVAEGVLNPNRRSRVWVGRDVEREEKQMATEALGHTQREPSFSDLHEAIEALDRRKTLKPIGKAIANAFAKKGLSASPWAIGEELERTGQGTVFMDEDKGVCVRIGDKVRAWKDLYIQLYRERARELLALTGANR